MSVPQILAGTTTIRGALIFLSFLWKTTEFWRLQLRTPRPIIMASSLLLSEHGHQVCTFPSPSHPTGALTGFSNITASAAASWWFTHWGFHHIGLQPYLKEPCTRWGPSTSALPYRNPWMSLPCGMRPSYFYRTKLALDSVQIQSEFSQEAMCSEECMLFINMNNIV